MYRNKSGPYPTRGLNQGTLIWDGRNHAGRPIASGVYFAIIKTDDGSTQIKKFAVER